MRADAYLPLFFGDFLSSTIYWRGEEKALYLLLLGYQWSSGALPKDLEQLAQVACYEPKHFMRLWKRIEGKFEATAAGLVNLRLEEHREKSHEVSGKRGPIGRLGGLASGAARKAKAEAKRQAIAQANMEANGEPIGSILVGDFSSKTPSKIEPSNPSQSRVKSQELTKEGNRSES